MQFVEASNGWAIRSRLRDRIGAGERAWRVHLALEEGNGRYDGLMWMDTRVHADSIENCTDKPGNRKRISHLRRALNEFAGRVDVVIVSGEPGVSYGTAQPRIAEGGRAGTYWQVLELDVESGHFEVILRTKKTSE